MKLDKNNLVIWFLILIEGLIIIEGLLLSFEFNYQVDYFRIIRKLFFLGLVIYFLIRRERWSHILGLIQATSGIITPIMGLYLFSKIIGVARFDEFPIYLITFLWSIILILSIYVFLTLLSLYRNYPKSL